MSGELSSESRSAAAGPVVEVSALRQAEDPDRRPTVASEDALELVGAASAGEIVVERDDDRSAAGELFDAATRPLRRGARRRAPRRQRRPAPATVRASGRPSHTTSAPSAGAGAGRVHERDARVGCQMVGGVVVLASGPFDVEVTGLQVSRALGRQ